MNYKFCFTTFGKLLAAYYPFWVTYAKNLKKLCSFSQNFDRELINYSGMWIDTDVRFFLQKLPNIFLGILKIVRVFLTKNSENIKKKNLGGGRHPPPLCNGGLN